MRNSLKVLALLGSLVVLNGAAIAQNKYESLNDRMNEIEWRLASCEKVGYAPPCSEGCGDRCGCAPTCCAGAPCTTSGLFGGGEVSFLKFGQSAGGAGDYTYKASPRGWIGYQMSDGLGARTRLFDYHDRSPNALAITDIDILTLDFEVTHDFQFGKWDAMLSGGLRYAEYREEFFNNPNNFFEFSNSYGPVVGIELNRSLTDWLSLYGLLRESILIDDESTGFATDVGYNITEIQLGAELRYDVRRGYLFLRGAGEAQYWSGVSNVNSESVTLIGGNLSIGFAH